MQILVMLFTCFMVVFSEGNVSLRTEALELGITSTEIEQLGADLSIAVNTMKSNNLNGDQKKNLLNNYDPLGNSRWYNLHLYNDQGYWLWDGSKTWASVSGKVTTPAAQKKVQLVHLIPYHDSTVTIDISP